MVLQLLPAEEADAARIAEISSLAFGPNPVQEVCFPATPSDSEARVTKLVNELRTDKATVWMKVIDTELAAKGVDEMIAFGIWKIWETSRPPTSGPKMPSGPGINEAACQAFFGKMIELWEKRMGNKSHVYLHVLCTDPAHQKRGAGSMLLQWGNEKSDRLLIPSYLESSPAGKSTYERLGFQEVDVLIADFTPWNGIPDATASLMLREPQPVPSS